VFVECLLLAYFGSMLLKNDLIDSLLHSLCVINKLLVNSKWLKKLGKKHFDALSVTRSQFPSVILYSR
jgi:hypothetical protein